MWFYVRDGGTNSRCAGNEREFVQKKKKKQKRIGEGYKTKPKKKYITDDEKR